MLVIRRVLLSATAVTALLTCAPAWAQQAPPPPDDQQQPGAPKVSGGMTEDIVVTAQKREQTLLDVPLSISVVSGATLERQVTTGFQDYLKLVPGLQLTQDTPGAGRLILRGLNTGGISSTVAVYEDETPFGSSTGLANGAVLAGDFDTFDVARIEVLRGPQGTLYGASSLGGVVKFVTNAPDTTRLLVRGRAGIETTEGGDISYYGNAVVNLPLTDTLAVRASGSYRKNGGWIDSIGTVGSQVRRNVNDSELYSGRASLLWKPNTAISLQLNALLQNIDVNSPSVEESDAATLRTLYGGPTESIFVNPYTNIRYRLYNGVGEFDLGFATLTSSTSYSTQKQPARTDYTYYFGPTGPFGTLLSGIYGTSNFINDQNTNLKRFTQEVRLSRSVGSAIDLIVGGYYNHENALLFQNFLPLTTGTLAPITTPPVLGFIRLKSKYEEEAGFANGTFHLGSYFDIDLGGRYSHNSQDAIQIGDGILAGGPSNFTQNSSEGVFTYSVAPKIKFSRHASLYGRVAKGFRPGGPNALPPGAPDAARVFRSDSVISYEVGLKAETVDGMASIDIDAFHIDWKNIQLATVVQTDTGPFTYNGNGGSAKSDGIELTASVHPTPGLTVSGNGAFTNARLTSDAPAASGFTGDKLPYTPRYSIGLNSDYQWALTGNVQAFFGGSLRFLSKQRGPFDAVYIASFGRRAVIPSYASVDLSAGIEVGRYTIEAYARNLTNSDGKTSVSSITGIPNGAVQTGMIRPRTAGLSVTAAF